MFLGGQYSLLLPCLRGAKRPSEGPSQPWTLESRRAWQRGAQARLSCGPVGGSRELQEGANPSVPGEQGEGGGPQEPGSRLLTPGN